MAETKEPQATSHPAVENPRREMRFRSIGSVAIVLEMWTQGRITLNRAEVEYYMHRMQSLDMDVADYYAELYE